MRILLKCPTRSRPQRVMKTIQQYIRMANHPEKLGVAISCDTSDDSMQRTIIRDEILQILRPAEWKKVFYSDNHNKIEACNADMDKIDYAWDIVVLVSDDMIPIVKGYDDVIRNHMMARFPDTDGLLWFNDGCQGKKLNTLCIFGRKFYASFGYIYHPAYKSLFCDTELTDLCKTTLKDKHVYIPYCIIRHEHPGTGYPEYMDALYDHNQRYWSQDMYTYISRKAYDVDWSVLIPTIPGREQSLQRLVKSLHETRERVCPSLRMEITIGFDNREQSVGAKRQALLEKARGKYMSFIDDDDEITDAYLEDVWATIQGNFHVMRLRGQIGQYTFTHSLANKLTSPMANEDTFLRPPNHLNPMMTDVAKLIKFQDAFRGEDLDWTIRMSRAGFLTREYQSDPSRIHYVYHLEPRTVDASTLAKQQQTSYETMLQMVWTPNGAQAPASPQPQTQPALRLGKAGFVSSK